jgi:hypothetical protein
MQKGSDHTEPPSVHVEVCLGTHVLFSTLVALTSLAKLI